MNQIKNKTKAITKKSQLIRYHSSTMLTRPRAALSIGIQIRNYIATVLLVARLESP